MGRALVAVGVVLTLFIGVFAVLVYTTRDEDLVAVDALLAESLGVAVSNAGQTGDPLVLDRVTPFEWDRVVVFKPNTPPRRISQVLGFQWRGHLPYTAESGEVFAFIDDGRLVRFADYRGTAEFAGLQRPFAELTPEEAVFEVSGGVARPAG